MIEPPPECSKCARVANADRQPNRAAAPIVPTSTTMKPTAALVVASASRNVPGISMPRGGSAGIFVKSPAIGAFAIRCWSRWGADARVRGRT